MNAMELEKYILDHKLALKIAPEEIIDVYEASVIEGVPSAICCKNGKFYVIGTAGQGPFIISEE